MVARLQSIDGGARFRGVSGNYEVEEQALTVDGTAIQLALVYSMPELDTISRLEDLRMHMSNYFIRNFLAFKSRPPVPPNEQLPSEFYQDILSEMADQYIKEQDLSQGLGKDKTTNPSSYFHIQEYKTLKWFPATLELNASAFFKIAFVTQDTATITYHDSEGNETEYQSIPVIKRNLLYPENEGVADWNNRLGDKKFKPVPITTELSTDTRPAVKRSQLLKFQASDDSSVYVVLENRRKKNTTVFDCGRSISMPNGDTMTLFEAIWGLAPSHVKQAGTQIDENFALNWCGGYFSAAPANCAFKFAGVPRPFLQTIQHPYSKGGNTWDDGKEEYSARLLSGLIVVAQSFDPAGSTDQGRVKLLNIEEKGNIKLVDAAFPPALTLHVLDYIRESDHNESLNRRTTDDPKASTYCSIVELYHPDKKAAICDDAAGGHVPVGTTLQFAASSSQTNPATHAYDAQEKIDEAKRALGQYKYFKLSFVTEHTAIDDHRDDLKAAFKDEIVRSLGIPDALADRVIVDIE